MKKKREVSILFILASLLIAASALALHGCGHGASESQVTLVGGTS